MRPAHSVEGYQLAVEQGKILEIQVTVDTPKLGHLGSPELSQLGKFRICDDPRCLNLGSLLYHPTQLPTPPRVMNSGLWFYFYCF